MKVKILLCLVLGFMSFACSDNDDDKGPVKNDVYVLSTEYDYTSGETAVRYYKNGEAFLVSNEGEATGIFVHGKDVYVSGEIYQDSKVTPVYWKNGKKTVLSSESVQAYTGGIAVINGDVYVAGSDMGTLVFWKNGTRTLLEGNNDKGYISSVYTDGTDLYIAGYQSTSIDIKARYWKNGKGVDLTDGKSESAIASIVAVKGVVYAAGSKGPDEGYWKNGVSTKLDIVSADAIAVYGDDIYVGGYDRNENTWKPALFINDKLQFLPAEHASEVTGLAADSEGYYAVGTEEDQHDNDMTVVWKNGEKTILSKADIDCVNVKVFLAPQ